MPEATRPIAIIPGECFRWQPRVQFIDSFQTRNAALTCAFEHGYNLIVERKEEGSAQFDVLDDPKEACTAGLELELLKTEEVLVDPYAEGWTSLMILSVWRLSRRFASVVASLYIGQVAPRLRHAASGRGREEFQRALRQAWQSRGNWNVAGRTREFAAFIFTIFQREIRPFCRFAACRCWWSDPAIALRRGWHRYSQGSITDVPKRLSAEASVLYARKIVPFCRSAARRCWWSDRTIALRRGWHRYSQGSITDVAKRLAAEASVMYAREAAPRLHHALVRCRQADIQGACRRAWRVALLTAIRLTDRLAAAVAAFYVGQVAPRLQQAAVRYQQADLEGALRRSVVAVAPPHQSNASQIH